MGELKVSATMHSIDGIPMTNVVVTRGNKCTTNKWVPTDPSQIRHERTSCLWQMNGEVHPPTNRGGITRSTADRLRLLQEGRRLKDAETAQRYGND